MNNLIAYISVYKFKKDLFKIILTIFFGLFVSPVLAYSGCTDVNSSNYDSGATIDDGSCFLCSSSAPVNCSQDGCSLYSLYWDFGNSVCTDDVLGCTDTNSNNYDSLATIDDGSCNTCNVQNSGDCSQIGCSSISYFWDNDQTLCRPNQLGCSDSFAENYNPLATVGSNNEYCLYCSPNSLENCSNESDCLNQSGQWINATCSDGGLVDSTIDGEISIIAPVVGSSYDFFQSISSDHLPLLEQKCIRYNSSNICDSWRWDIDKEFMEFIISLVWKIGLGLVFVGGIIFFVYRVFLFVKTFLIGSK